MTVYADILFIINVLMDTTLLWAAGMLLKESIRPMRIILGASAGSAMYIFSLFFPYSGPAGQILLTVFSVTLSAVIAYRPKTIWRLCVISLMTVILSFAASGIIFSLMVISTYSSPGTAWKNVFDGFSYKLLFITSALFYAVIKTGRKWMIKTAADKREFFDIDVTVNGQRAELRALADSGNSLKDDITGSHIIIAEYRAVKGLIPIPLETDKDGVDMFKMLSETEYKNRLRLIPFKSIGEKNGILLGIKTDTISIRGEGRAGTEKQGVILCLFSGELDIDGRFNAIINYEIFL